jgi:hypothetical protein
MYNYRIRLAATTTTGLSRPSQFSTPTDLDCHSDVNVLKAQASPHSRQSTHDIAP